MTRVEQWPPPDWTEVVVTWDWLMLSHRHSIKELVDKVINQPGGCYHLHGKGAARDFAFRFEDPRDATWFRLILPS